MFETNSGMLRTFISWMIASCMLALSLMGCAEASEQTNTTEKNIFDVAREYVEKNLPGDAYVLKYEAFIDESGDNWVVWFRPPGPPTAGGGGPEIYIDKKSRKVIKVERAM